MSGFAHELERNEIKKTDIPVFHVGDSVDVHVRIKEGDKERIQIFAGVCIARKGGGLRETFTVRRIVEGEGVERIFPLHSPNVSKIEVKRAGKVRRAKLYFLRDRVGKSTRIQEKLNATHLGQTDESRSVEAEAPAEKPAEAKTEAKAPEKAEAKA
jgi:large subunit ribosomal protein L19